MLRMLRTLHSVPGLAAALLVCLMAITGAVLSLEPLAQQVGTAPAASSLSVAELAARVVAALPEAESLSRSASGSITAQLGRQAVRIDPESGASLGPVATSGLFAWMTELHRSLLLGEAGRVLAGLGAAAMAVLAITGVALLVNRQGGLRAMFGAVKGSPSQQLHVTLSRIAVAGLLLSAMTGAYLALASFGLVSDGASSLDFPPFGSGAAPAPITELAGLAKVPVGELRDLVLPLADDPGDVFTLTTNAGTSYIDQATGEVLEFTANAPLQALYEAIYTLHTGQGVWWLGLLLGLASLTVPALMVTGTVIWLRRRQARPRIRGNAGWQVADTVILVGSQNNTTWGFAETLRKALAANGHAVHVERMDAVRAGYPKARNVLVLAATYGDGAAPQSAQHFLSRVGGIGTARLRYAVLGFGDRRFQHFCAYADAVEAALAGLRLEPLLPVTRIDRQSAQSFAQWGLDLGHALGEPLHLAHQAERVATRPFRLVSRDDFGVEVQAPIAVLRFEPQVRRAWWRPAGGLRRGEAFEAGDLVGIIPPGDSIPRYYSIASDHRSGGLEIAVRKQVGGRCSEFLFGLEPGDRVDGFVRRNPDFRPPSGRRPLILIGAGTGVAPLVGFVRNNAAHRPIHLFFGGRDPRSDFLFGEEMLDALRSGQLSRLITAFSRSLGGGYVQDRLREDANALRDLLAQGASIMVCGGAGMALGVREALDAILLPVGQSVALLRQRQRYLEDVY